MLGVFLERVRTRAPIVHCITNCVSANDTANLLLAAGASPILADEPCDAAEVSAHCDGLCLNLGMLKQYAVESMLNAGHAAAQRCHPVLLDPVGVGISSFRMETARRLLSHLPITAIRGNLSELRALSGFSSVGRGVDADFCDTVCEDTLAQTISFVKGLARKHGAVIAVTGAIDLVGNADRCFVIRNGRPEMRLVTGTGCQLSALAAAFLAANPDSTLEAVAAAVCAMGLAGEIAFSRMQPGDGNTAYRSRIIDSIYNMDAQTLERGSRYEIR